MILQNKVPPQLQYRNIIPKGFPSIYKQWIIDPATNNKNWSNNDIVRFNLMNMGKGVFDPYKSFIEITVSCNINDLPVGLLQIDSSAQSFIQQFVLYSNGRQIERINQYGVLSSFLNDMGLNQIITQGRQSQGLGYGSFDTMPFPKSNGNTQVTSRTTNNAQQIAASTIGFGTNFPTIGNFWGQPAININQNSIVSASRAAKGHVTNANVLMTGSDLNGGNMLPQSTGMQASLITLGYANNLRAQYQTKYIEPKYPQNTQSIPLYQLQLQQSVANNTYPFKYSANTPYNVTARNQFSQTLYFDQTKSYNHHVINCANFGFTNMFCPFFTRGSFQPIISCTVPQCMMQSGVVLPTKVPIYRKKFKIPLISAVIGMLIDPSQYCLIPLQSLNSCMIQLTLDPYAMFTSGYCDVSQLDDVGMKNQQKRCYVIQKIQYKLQTYHFLDEEVQQYINSSLNKQITILSNFWLLSNQYQIAGGNGANNSYIVGCNATHLNQLVCLFVPNDYQQYSFARKHFRISNNVKKYWSKIAVDYWPPQPFRGNAGNISSNNNDDDNTNFVEQLYATGQYMFAKTSLPRINQYNFAINQRLYNVKNVSTFYDPAILNNQNYSFSSSSVNSDTAMGMAWLHQNRCIGKAAFLIDYTPFSQSDHLLQGINVSSINNFEVIFESDSSNVFPRDQTLYIFCKCSGIVTYGQNQIRTFGRG